MKFELHRYDFTDKRTIGKLSIDGVFFCYTLEDAVRPVKIPHETAIGYGVYRVIVNMSARFKCLMPLLVDVLNYVGVRIHWGNTDANTDGCILVGWGRGVDTITGSRDAFKALMGRLMVALAAGEQITIEILKADILGDGDAAAKTVKAG